MKKVALVALVATSTIGSINATQAGAFSQGLSDAGEARAPESRTIEDKCAWIANDFLRQWREMDPTGTTPTLRHIEWRSVSYGGDQGMECAIMLKSRDFDHNVLEDFGYQTFYIGYKNANPKVMINSIQQ